MLRKNSRQGYLLSLVQQQMPELAWAVSYRPPSAEPENENLPLRNNAYRFSSSLALGGTSCYVYIFFSELTFKVLPGKTAADCLRNLLYQCRLRVGMIVTALERPCIVEFTRTAVFVRTASFHSCFPHGHRDSAAIVRQSCVLSPLRSY